MASARRQQVFKRRIDSQTLVCVCARASATQARTGAAGQRASRSVGALFRCSAPGLFALRPRSRPSLRMSPREVRVCSPCPAPLAHPPFVACSPMSPKWLTGRRGERSGFKLFPSSLLFLFTCCIPLSPHSEFRGCPRCGAHWRAYNDTPPPHPPPPHTHAAHSRSALPLRLHRDCAGMPALRQRCELRRAGGACTPEHQRTRLSSRSHRHHRRRPPPPPHQPPHRDSSSLRWTSTRSSRRRPLLPPLPRLLLALAALPRLPLPLDSLPPLPPLRLCCLALRRASLTCACRACWCIVWLKGRSTVQR